MSVPVSALTIVQTTSVASAAPGTVVGYTVTVTNSGVVAYTGATFTDPLAGVLDDAAYNGDAAATSGTVSYASAGAGPALTWTGNLAAGATATITFSVTVSSPDTGNKVLASTVTSATAGSNCPAGGTDARCTATVNVQGLTITATANASSATPGSTGSVHGHRDQQRHGPLHRGERSPTRWRGCWMTPGTTATPPTAPATCPTPART